jgi:hypothetical protein
MIRFMNCTRAGRVVLASGNGKSLVLGWEDGMLGGYVGTMPALAEGDGYIDLIEGKPVEITKLDADA